jgi:sulfur relay (sulfurtransferase) complex TusBCD TusD component (DsrE family)
LVKRRERQDLVMHEVAMELCNGAAAQRGFVNTVDALKDIEPAHLPRKMSQAYRIGKHRQLSRIW